MEPELRYCTSADGTSMAVYTLGQGPPLVCLASVFACAEKDWERPEGCAYYETLAEGRRIVWFDCRGVGASQRDVDDVSLEAQLADLTAVINSRGLERFELPSKN